MTAHRKQTFLRKFRDRHWLRFHMSLILLATAASGVLASKLFLFFNMNNFVLRYPLAVFFAYAVFFLCIKLWLIYVSPAKQKESSLWDHVDIPTPSSGGSGGIPPLSGGGGQFSGGGASGSFDVAEGASSSFEMMGETSEGASSALEAVGDAAGEAVGALGEEAGFIGVIVLAALAALLAAVLGSAVYVISEAPVILSEAAFEGMLAVSLVRKARLIDDEDWIGSIFRTTWIPFAITLSVSLVAALVLHRYFPEASRLSDILG